MREIADFSKIKITDNDLIKSNGSIGRLNEILEKTEFIEELKQVIKTPEKMNFFMKKGSTYEGLEIVYNEILDILQKRNDYDKIKLLDNIWKNYKSHNFERQTVLVLLLDLVC